VFEAKQRKPEAGNAVLAFGIFTRPVLGRSPGQQGVDYMERKEHTAKTSTIRRLATPALIAVGMAWLNGCATQQLWEDTSFNQPAPDPNLRLFHSGKRSDVLVEYDELRDRTGAIRRRAFFLYKHEARTDPVRTKPRFVNPGATNQVTSIAILPPPAPVGLAGKTNLYAVARTNSPVFSLYSSGREISAHELPTYSDGFHRTTQILLTPLAVTADAVLVASVVGLIWLSSGTHQY
jgi:hypothetical protein